MSTRYVKCEKCGDDVQEGLSARAVKAEARMAELEAEVVHMRALFGVIILADMLKDHAFQSDDGPSVADEVRALIASPQKGGPK